MPKSDWINYAANISGQWEVCADCSVATTGKKLHRQYNFWRQVLGLPYAAVPVDPTAVVAAFPNVTSATTSGGTIASVSILGYSGTLGDQLCAQVGKGLANPVLAFTSDVLGGGLFFSGPIFDWVVAISNALDVNDGLQHLNVTVGYCAFGPDGQPGNRGTLQYSIDP